MELSIYFDDLNDEAKKEVLKFYGLDSEDSNFELTPLAILETE